MKHLILAIKLSVVSLLFGGVLAGAVGTVQTSSVYAAGSYSTSKETACEGAGIGKACDGGNGLKKAVTAIVNVLTAIVGVAAVIMIIIGGFRYITSAGDANKVSGAKSTIIYAIIGLVVVALAQILVHFVINASV